MATLGSVEFSAITEESPRRETNITDKPVEKGANITDHAQPQPWVVNITGQVTGADAGQRYAQLQHYWRTATLLRYVGRNIASNMIIESFPSEHDARIANGFRFNMTLKRVIITRPETVEIVAPDPAVAVTPMAGDQGTSTQVKEPDDGGQQQIQRKDADEGQRQSFLLRTVNAAADYFGGSDPDFPAYP